MSIQVQRRREAATFLSTFTGAVGELLVDTTNNRVQVHDGVTAGGWPAAKLSEVPVAPSPHGAQMTFGIVEGTIACSGATSVSAVQIPSGAIIFGVSVRVITAITGATSFWVDPTNAFNGGGGAYTANHLFGIVGVAMNTTNSGLTGSPLASYSASTITLTAQGASFSGGVVRVSIQYMTVLPPTS